MVLLSAGEGVPKGTTGSLDVPTHACDACGQSHQLGVCCCGIICNNLETYGTISRAVCPRGICQIRYFQLGVQPQRDTCNNLEDMFCNSKVVNMLKARRRCESAALVATTVAVLPTAPMPGLSVPQNSHGQLQDASKPLPPPDASGFSHAARSRTSRMLDSVLCSGLRGPRYQLLYGSLPIRKVGLRACMAV